MLALIVDDCGDDRKLLRYYFTRRGWDIAEAANGEEALRVARSVLPDLIVSDALMPRMDGFELLREIRNSSLRDVPFIIYTCTYLQEEDRSFSLDSGADAFLEKPRPPDEFWKVVDEVMERRRSG
ncbi:MAG TPA: response regulator, partial [Verrucomicrobiae bacterium]|nr:response regulator [Verrucomicrobiae bacterium]